MSKNYSNLCSRIDSGDKAACEELLNDLARVAPAGVVAKARAHYSGILPIFHGINEIHRYLLGPGSDLILHACVAGREVGMAIDFKLDTSFEPKTKKRLNAHRGFTRALIRTYLLEESNE